MQAFKTTLTENFVWVSALILGIMAFGVFVFLHFDETQNDQQPVIIRYVDNIAQAQKDIIERFNKAYEGRIHVQAIDLPFTSFSTNDRKEILARALRNHSDQIDVLSLDVIWSARFAKWALPLNKYFADSILDRIIPQALASCLVRDTLVAVPMYIDATVMYYRMDLLHKIPGGPAFEKRLLAGTTWDDFRMFLIKAGAKGRNSYLFAAKDFEGLVCNFFEMIPEKQIQKLFKLKSINFEQPVFTRGLEQLVRFRQDELTPDSVGYFDEYQCYLWAASHDALFIKGWPGLMQHHIAVFGNDVAQRINIAPVPHLGSQDKAAIIGGWNLMISRFSTHKKEALTFLKFVEDIKQQKILFDVSGYIPINKMVYADSEFVKKHTLLGFYKKQIAQSKHRPFRIDYTRMSDILAHYLNQAFLGKKSVHDALESATRQINTNSVFIK